MANVITLMPETKLLDLMDGAVLLARYIYIYILSNYSVYWYGYT